MKKILLTLFLCVIAFLNAQTLLRSFTFNNTYYDTTNSENFKNTYSNSAAGFTTGRDGNANTAINFTSSKAMYAGISNLPIGASARTVSLWVNFNNIASTQTIYFYGTDAAGQCFGLTYNSNNSLEFFKWGSSVIVSNTNFNTTSWYHIVVSYDGTNIKIYINGSLVKTQAFTLNTASGTIFRLGDTSNVSSIANLQAKIDDLQIYNGALSDSQVSSLYNNNTLSTQNFNSNNFNINISPNPVKDILNIQFDGKLKSVEIYNTQGQKLITSAQKQINISSLSSGVYMIRIEDNENRTISKKIIKK